MRTPGVVVKPTHVRNVGGFALYRAVCELGCGYEGHADRAPAALADARAHHQTTEHQARLMLTTQEEPA